MMRQERVEGGGQQCCQATREGGGQQWQTIKEEVRGGAN
jgi:hypothetical protein